MWHTYTDAYMHIRAIKSTIYIFANFRWTRKRRWRRYFVSFVQETFFVVEILEKKSYHQQVDFFDCMVLSSISPANLIMVSKFFALDKLASCQKTSFRCIPKSIQIKRNEIVNFDALSLGYTHIHSRKGEVPKYMCWPVLALHASVLCVQHEFRSLICSRIKRGIHCCCINSLI